MTRFNKVAALSLAPGHCFSCRTSVSPQGFADLGFSDEWLGAFYLCAPCVAEMARLFGMKAEYEVAARDEALTVSQETVHRQEAELAKLHAVRNAIRAFREDGFDVEPGTDLPGDAPGGKRRGRPRRTAEPEGGSEAQEPGTAAE